MIAENRKKGIAFIILSAFGFALMAMFVRLCDNFGQCIPSVQKAFFRNIIALTAAAAILATNVGGATDKRKCKITPTVLLRSILGTLGIFANFYALGKIPIAESQTLNKTAPFFTVLFAWLFLGEKFNKKDFLRLIVAFAGALLIIKPDFNHVYRSSASLVALGGGLAAGGAYASLRKLGQENISPAFIILFFSAFSTAMCLPFIASGFTPLTMAQTLILTAAGLSAALGQFGITLAYKYARPGEIAVYDYVNIPFTLLLGFMFFNQRPDALSLAGMAIITAAATVRRNA
jgi:drug/metabolite transporter (DMT)-like permease